MNARRFRQVAAVWLLIVLVCGIGTGLGVGAEASVGAEANASPFLLPGQLAQSKTELSPGVDHFSIAIGWPQQHQAINVVRIARSVAGARLEAVLGKGLVSGTEPVSAQVARAQTGNGDATVVAGINGDFFLFSPVAGIPFGLHIVNGELALSPNDWPSFAITSAGEPFIGYTRWSSEVIAYNALGEETRRARLSAVNHLRAANDLTLYTPRFGASTHTDATGAEVVLLGPPAPALHTVHTYVVAGPPMAAGNAAIPANGVVLSAAGIYRTWVEKLAPGDRIDLQITMEPPFDTAVTAITGNKLLVAGGKPALAPADAAAKERHPRSAVGYNDDYIFLVTVDGRQPGYADGMTLSELANLLVDLGASAAINLDGGGSTTMVVGAGPGNSAVVVNRPSEGRERAVANSLLVLSNTPRPTTYFTNPAPAVLTDFETLSPWQPAVARASVSIGLSELGDPVFSGYHSLRLNYNLAGAAGTPAAYAQADPGISISELPQRIGLWVYGDGGGHWLRGSYTDAAGVRYMLDFTTVHGLDWTGWRYVAAEVDQAAVTPLSLDRIYVTELDPAQRTAGVLFFDSLQVEMVPLAAADGKELSE